MAVPRLGRLKNSEKQLSQTWEERKTLQAEFPTPWKPKNAENQLVARERNAKNEKNCLLPTGNLQKTRKTGCCEKKQNPESLLSDFRGSVLF